MILLALVKFVSPYHKITGVETDVIPARDVRELCSAIIEKYGKDMHFLVDENGDLSRKLVLLINRKNAYILDGSDTLLEPDTEAILMSYLGWA